MWIGLIILCSLANADQSTALLEPPRTKPKIPESLSLLLRNQGGTNALTADDWKKRRKELREQWLDFLGPLPKQRAPLKTEFMESDDLGDFTRQRVRYQIEDGVFTEAYLLQPKPVKGKLPAVVVFHPTTALRAKGVAGLDATYSDEKQQGVHLVKRGYIVLCPNNFIFDEGTNVTAFTAAAAKMRERHPDWTGMTRMLLDAMRATDFLEALPRVDSKRIGCIGHSLGAKVALYAAAFDERYKAAVFSEGGIGLKFSNWDAPWYLGSKIHEPDFKLEHHQLIALIAPRALLLLAGDSADSDKSWTFIESAHDIYKLLGVPDNIGWFNHHLGHRYPPEARKVAEEFLVQHLKN